MTVAPTAASSRRRTSPTTRIGGSAVIVASVSSPYHTPRNSDVIVLRAAYQLLGVTYTTRRRSGVRSSAITRPSSLVSWRKRPVVGRNA
jgi:hypothetical protein